MNTTKLNDWLQMTAAVGVIAGLVLVAYELRISNRMGYEQANAEGIRMWTDHDRAKFSPELVELIVRNAEGESD